MNTIDLRRNIKLEPLKTKEKIAEKDGFSLLKVVVNAPYNEIRIFFLRLPDFQAESLLRKKTVTISDIDFHQIFAAFKKYEEVTEEITNAIIRCFILDTPYKFI